MKSRTVLRSLAIVALLAGSLWVSAASAPAPTALSKIAARVIAETANGGTTEALVVLAEQADLSGAEALPTKAEKGRYVFDTLQAAAGRTQAPLRALLEQRGVAYQAFYIVNAIKVSGDNALILELAARADVARIDANPRVRSSLPQQTGIDLRGPQAVQTIEWNVTRVKAPDVWALGFRGEGQVVADADTGVDWAHPALKGHYRGWNGTTADHNYNWHDATSARSTTPVDPHGHGTFTTSQMVGDDGLGNQVGVAPGAGWIGCRNMDSSGTGSPTSYIECFEWLLAPYPIGGDPSQGNPAMAPDSINNSWGCPATEGCSADTLKATVEAVRAAGIFPAVAAGNAGPACRTVADPPGTYDAAFSVGATTSTDAIASFSSRGPVVAGRGVRLTKPDISAPGQSIRGAVPGTGYQSGWSGTSMATPHVAGAVALLWQARPALAGNVSDTELAFTSHAIGKTTRERCGVPGTQIPNNTFGWGLLDVYAAVIAP